MLPSASIHWTEAVPVGIGQCLFKEDHVVSVHRSHAHYLAKGSLEKMLGELFGKAVGCARGKGGLRILLTLEVMYGAVPIVGSSISIGTGIGLAVQQQRNNKVAVYFGDGATEEGVRRKYGFRCIDGSASAVCL